MLAVGHKPNPTMGGATVTPSCDGAATGTATATNRTDASSATTHTSSSTAKTTAGLFRLALCEAAGGAVAAVIADTVLYAMDSAKIRAQASSSSSPLQPAAASTIAAASGHSFYYKNNYNFQILFRGLVPTVLLGSVPVFGTFFLLYAPLKQVLLVQYDDNDMESSSSSSSSSLSLLLPLVSGFCAIPATLIGVPADVLKKRLVLLDSTKNNNDGTVRTALTHIAASPHAQGSLLRGLFAGWHVNLIRDIPFAVVKLGLYECFVEQCYQRQFFVHPPKNGTSYNHCNDDSAPVVNNNNSNNDSSRSNHQDHYQQPQKKQHLISATGVAICGVASGVCCAIVTCPLDVVNTRIKAIGRGGSIRQVAMDIVVTEGSSALFRGVVLRSVILGLGSFIFWPLQTTIATWLEAHVLVGTQV